MKIRKATGEETCILSISCGSIFSYGGELYIKVDEYPIGIRKGVSLSDGSLTNFQSTAMVIPVSAEVVINA